MKSRVAFLPASASDLTFHPHGLFFPLHEHISREIRSCKTNTSSVICKGHTQPRTANMFWLTKVHLTQENNNLTEKKRDFILAFLSCGGIVQLRYHLYIWANYFKIALMCLKSILCYWQNLKIDCCISLSFFSWVLVLQLRV